MIRKILFLAVFVAMLGVFSVSYAGQCPICAKASAANQNWPERSACQFTQGCGHLLLGWTYAFSEPVAENQCNTNPCPVNKTTNGLLKGWGKAVITSGEGLMEILTFWTPVRIVPDSGGLACAETGAKCSPGPSQKKCQA